MPGDWLAVAANVTASPSTRRLWAIFMSFLSPKARRFCAGAAKACRGGAPVASKPALRGLCLCRSDWVTRRRLLRQGAQLRFHLAPLALGPAVDADDPGGGAGIDAAIKSLV